MNTILPQISGSENQTRALRNVLPEILPHLGTIGIRLEKGQIHSIPLEVASVLEIRVLEGTAWITMEGDPCDYGLEAGDTMTFSGPGLLVIEGLLESNRVESGFQNRENNTYTPRLMTIPGEGIGSN